MTFHMATWPISSSKFNPSTSFIYNFNTFCWEWELDLLYIKKNVFRKVYSLFLDFIINFFHNKILSIAHFNCTNKNSFKNWFWLIYFDSCIIFINSYQKSTFWSVLVIEVIMLAYFFYIYALFRVPLKKQYVREPVIKKIPTNITVFNAAVLFPEPKPITCWLITIWINKFLQKKFPKSGLPSLTLLLFELIQQETLFSIHNQRTKVKEELRSYLEEQIQ